jgi:hypothetical protein
MAYRAMIDDDPSPQAAAMAAKVPAIMKQNWIDGLELDAAEERFINAPLGALIPQQRIEASWLIERMAVLAWAIGAAELPPFFTKIDGARVSAALGMFSPDAEERIAGAKLRSVDEIIMGARTYGVLMWRLAKYFSDPAPIDLYKKVTDPDGRHLMVDGLEFHDCDLAIEGVPLRQVLEDKLQLVGAIVYHRNKQFRWLFGFERGESTVTTVN